MKPRRAELPRSSLSQVVHLDDLSWAWVNYMADQLGMSKSAFVVSILTKLAENPDEDLDSDSFDDVSYYEDPKDDLSKFFAKLEAKDARRRAIVAELKRKRRAAVAAERNRIIVSGVTDFEIAHTARHRAGRKRSTAATTAKRRAAAKSKT